MKQLRLNCTQVTNDFLEADRIHKHVYLGVCQYATIDDQADVKLTPTQARELAAWLEQAALEAEQADD